MNAHAKPAVFMPLFATSTTEGPANYQALIAQMHAAGMMAGAWMVEDMVRRIEAFNEAGVTQDDFDYIKVKAKELSAALEYLASEMGELTEELADLVVSDEDLDDERDSDIRIASKHADEVCGALRSQSKSADHLYTLLDEES